MSGFTPSRASERTRNFNSRNSVDRAIRTQDPDGCWVDYWRLIHALQSRSQLLNKRLMPQTSGDLQSVAVACRHLAEHTNSWLRMPETWTSPRTNSRREVWNHFVAHLLHQYETPSLFAGIWLREYVNVWHRDLHFHLGQGKSLRKFDMPHGLGRVSKSVARWFMQSPPDLNVDQAVRWGQVRAFGGCKRLARLLAIQISTHVDESWHECWTEAMEFIVRHQPISEQQTKDILSFINLIRFKPTRISVGPWMDDEPLNKDFSIRGWTLRRLRRYMVSWRDSIPIPIDRKSKVTWATSGLERYDVSTDSGDYQIAEICTDHELKFEGRIMQHCVGSYTRACQRQLCAIWSLRLINGSRCRRLATIQVDRTNNEIVQVKAKSNKTPVPEQMSIIREWAQQQCLKVNLIY